MAIAGSESFLRNVWFFDLNGRVIDSKHFTRDAIHTSEQFGTAEVLTAGHDVTTHCKYTGRERPHMQIVNGSDAVHKSQLLSEPNNIYMRGRPFQQDVHGVANDNP